MYTESNEQFAQLRDRGGDFARLASASAQERADALSDFYLPVTPEAGRLLYALVRATRPGTVVEFGMSLGFSRRTHFSRALASFTTAAASRLACLALS
jgi:predicted O-methyltransferase YrrM